MNEKELEELARWAAERLNGGSFYEDRWYQFEHRKAWMTMIGELIKKVKERDDA